MKKIGIIVAILLVLLNTSLAVKAEEPLLTEREKDFIKAHPVIHLGIDPEFVPYEFIDSDGLYKGIASDYIKLISERTGIKMVVETGLTWSEAYEAAVERNIDVLPCVSQTEDRKRYFLFSEPYYHFQRVIVVLNSNKTINNMEDLKHLKVAVQTNSSHHGFLKGYPDISLSLYADVEDALTAVSTGTETAFVGNLATISYLAKANGITNLKYIKLDSEDKQLIYFAVRNDWPELVGIINKGLESITEEEKIEINNRWIGIENKIDYAPIIRIVAISGLMLLSILLVSLYWVIRLKKEVAKRIIIEEDLRRAKLEAEIANQVKSSFLARMSHEIRTPLNAITGMAYLIKKTDTTITQKIYLEKITQAAYSMLGIINDILDFSKIEAGKVEIERISFSLDKVVQHVVNIVAVKVEEQQIGFNLRKDPKLPVNFFGDPKRLEQILINIINNAVKFTSEGEVSFAIRLAGKEGALHKLEFIVQDTGIGMTEEQIEQLFKPFSQGDSSINRRFGGTGLGLSIVKSLVEMMGGEINVSSIQGEGSTFTLRLPLEADLEKDFEERQKTAVVYFQEIKALILDRSSVNLHLLEEYLTAFGISGEFVSDRDQAEKLLEESNVDGKKPFNLFIVDYDTPEEDGFKYIERIKRNPLLKNMPRIIMMVPLMREELLEKVEELDMELGIAKPVIPSVLYNGILEIFKVKELETERMGEIAITGGNARPEQFYNVLVVEDNKTNQFIAKSILEQAGFEVALADDGEAGVAYFREHQDETDLILMDLHMPVLSGYEASAQIRRLDKNVPIVAMTADAIAGVEEECRRSGIEHYISKPFEPEKFVNTLIGILQLPDASARNRREAGKQEKQCSGEESLLDQTDGLRRMGNNKKLYHMVLAEYLEENKDVAELLDKAMREENYKEAVQIVHKNKGGSGNIGAKKLHAVAAALQKALEAGTQKDVDALNNEFASLLDKLLKEIEQLIAE